MTTKEFIDRFKGDLPGSKAHEAFAPYRTHFEQNATGPRKKAAVGIHFYLKNEDWHFILIERSSYDGKHSAQMAFPGGKPESSDLHLEHTARRESEEEIGIPMNNGIKLAELSMVWIPVSSFEVTPFVFLHHEQPEIHINKREVADYFEVNLADLLSEENISTTSISVNEQTRMKHVPCFVLNEKIVWGATALMLAELKILLASN
ncbi:MAG: NUDIX hydrolase [Flavobacteriales bacterium]